MQAMWLLDLCELHNEIHRTSKQDYLVKKLTPKPSVMHKPRTIGISANSLKLGVTAVLLEGREKCRIRPWLAGRYGSRLIRTSLRSGSLQGKESSHMATSNHSRRKSGSSNWIHLR